MLGTWRGRTEPGSSEASRRANGTISLDSSRRPNRSEARLQLWDGQTRAFRVVLESAIVQDSFSEQVRSGQIQLQPLVPESIVKVDDRTRAGTASDSGVVDENVSRADSFKYSPHDVRGPRAVTQVAGIATAAPPAFCTSSTNVYRPRSVRAVAAILAPSIRIIWAIARAIPRLAPVIKATRLMEFAPAHRFNRLL